MTSFELAKKNYDRGLWTSDMLEKLVERNKLTQNEFDEIVGENTQE